jgi:hypothetical protein
VINCKVITKLISEIFSGTIARAFNLDFMNGVCVPAACSVERVVLFVNRRFLLRADLVGVGAQCQTGDPEPFEFMDYLAM